MVYKNKISLIKVYKKRLQNQYEYNKIKVKFHIKKIMLLTISKKKFY